VASPDPTVQYGTPAFYAALGRAFVAMCGVFAGLMLIEFIDQRLHNSLDQRFGIEPHEVSGLDGVIFAPFLHSGWDHLLRNSSAIIILGTFALAAGTRRFLQATVIIALASGLGVWCLTPRGYLVLGASGIAFGWLGLLFVRGLVDRSRWHFAVGGIAALLYGWQLNLLLPKDQSISWQGHLCGFIGGAIAAVLTRRRLPKPTDVPA